MYQLNGKDNKRICSEVEKYSWLLKYYADNGKILSKEEIINSDARIPFGGIKKSGFGRELSRYRMLEFTNIKSVRLYDELVSEHYVE